MTRSSHLLCVIVDCNACWWGQLAESDEDVLASMIRSLAAFCNAHSVQNAANRLLVLGAAHGLSSTLVYSSDSAQPTDDPCASIVTGLQRCLQESASWSGTSKECPLAGPLATALCHINRARKEDKQHNDGRTARILIVKVSDDTSTQHMRLMNMFFAAQKQSVALDVCAVQQSSATMQQAADITGGLYVRVDHPSGLLQYLLTVFLADPSLRPKMVLPASGDVDYRPACRCHQKLISIGWVCSVCLSVLCQFTPICLTCQTVFKVPILAKTTKKRKRNA